MQSFKHTLSLITIGVLLAFVVIAADLFLKSHQSTAASVRTVVLPSSTLAPPTPTPSLTATIQPTTPPTVTATASPLPTDMPPSPIPTTAVLTHIVQAGDTLYQIAVLYGVTIEQLAAANQRSTTDFLYIDEELIIPGHSDQPTLTPTAVYTDSIAYAAYLPEGAPTAVNGIPYETILYIPEEVRQHILTIYAYGQEHGRNPHAFAKVGDSTVENDHFLSRFDETEYNLGDYAYLQRAIDYYANSFNRDSAAVRIGLHAWTMFDPLWADKFRCEANESPITCELRLHNPTIVLIRIGSNDVGIPAAYEQSLRQLIEHCLAEGVIPVLGTKADRNDGPDNINNEIIRQLAAVYEIPLWEYDLVADTLPGRGLDEDGIHMNTYYAHDYNDPIAFQKGHATHNLTALIVLDLLTQIVTAP